MLALTGQFCMETLHFQSQYFQLKSSSRVFKERLFVFQKGFSKVKVLKTFKTSAIVTSKYTYLLKRAHFTRTAFFEDPKLFLLALK